MALNANFSSFKGNLCDAPREFDGAYCICLAQK